MKKNDIYKNLGRGLLIALLTLGSATGVVYQEPAYAAGGSGGGAGGSGGGGGAGGSSSGVGASSVGAEASAAKAGNAAVIAKEKADEDSAVSKSTLE